MSRRWSGTSTVGYRRRDGSKIRVIGIAVSSLKRARHGDPWPWAGDSRGRLVDGPAVTVSTVTQYLSFEYWQGVGRPDPTSRMPGDGDGRDCEEPHATLRDNDSTPWYCVGSVAAMHASYRHTVIPSYHHTIIHSMNSTGLCAVHGGPGLCRVHENLTMVREASGVSIITTNNNVSGAASNYIRSTA